MNIHSLSLSLSPLGSALTSMSTQNRQVVSLTHAKERWMDEEEKGREGGRNRERERERESDRKTGYENQAEILHYDESFAPTFSSLLTLNPLPPLSLSLSSGPMCFLTISTFSCACRYPHPQSSSSLSTFLPASYPTYRRTGTRENAFLALRKDGYSGDVSFFFLFFFLTMRRMRMYFGEEEEGYKEGNYDDRWRVSIPSTRSPPLMIIEEFLRIVTLLRN